MENLVELYTHLSEEYSIVITEEYEKTWDNILNDKNTKCFFINHDNIIVVSCTITIISSLMHKCKSYTLIESVVSHKNYRGMEFGKNVVNKAIEFVKQENCHMVMLLTSKKETRGFYKKLGFDGNAKKGFQILL